MKRKQTTLRLPEELWERLKKESKEKGMSLSEYIIYKLEPLEVDFTELSEQG